MKKDTITLPRAMVEQALEAWLTAHYCHQSNHKAMLLAMTALRTALDQPQGEQPTMTAVAQRKLDDLLTSGYQISGYSIYHYTKHQHGFVTAGGLVGWWKPEGEEYTQPQVDQQPVQPLTD